ncbi:hypothetical protein CEXT_529351, partial [Caerostris extrusa]
WRVKPCNNKSINSLLVNNFLESQLRQSNFWNRTLTIFDKYRTMNTLKYVRLREEGSLNERIFKRAIVQKCDWAYEDFQTAEMVPDSTMRTLQGRFRKEDDKNTCLRKSVDTLVTVGRIVRRTREQHKLQYAGLYKKSEEANCPIIAKVVDKVVEKYLQSMGLSTSLKFWRHLDDWCHPSRKNGDPIPISYPISHILGYVRFVFNYLMTTSTKKLRGFWNRTLTIFDKYRMMNTLKYIRLREEGSLNERTFKKCDITEM